MQGQCRERVGGGGGVWVLFWVVIVLIVLIVLIVVVYRRRLEETGQCHQCVIRQIGAGRELNGFQQRWRRRVEVR